MGRTGFLLSLGAVGLAFGCGGPPAPAEPPRGTEHLPASEQLDSARVTTSSEAAAPVDSPAPETSAPPVTGVEPLPRGSKVLQIGDSFAGALGIPLGRLLEAEGVSSTLKHTDASYLTDWAWDGNLQKYIWRYNPDLIVITLGANELEIADPEARVKTIHKLVSLVGDRPCVWVAIPLWAGPKNGLMNVIERSASPCLYLDTNELMDVAALPRIRDGIHPTERAREDWAAVVVQWLRQHRKGEAGRPWSLRPD